MNDAELILFKVEENTLLEIWNDYIDLATENFDIEEHKDTLLFLENTIKALSTGEEVEIQNASTDMMHLLKNFIESFTYDTADYEFSFKALNKKGKQVEPQF